MNKRMGGLGIILALGWLPALQAEACVDGESNGFTCSHIEFIGHLSPAEMGGSGEVLNDIWGWVDDNGEEYALVGMQDGTAFVRIHDDGTLEFLGRLEASDGQANMSKAESSRHAHKCHDGLCGGENSAWRDIKVYGDHAYIVSEAAKHGVQIFDLNELASISGPSSQPLRRDGFYADIGHAHNIFINEKTRRAYVVGHDGNGRAGGLHILDLANPTNPAFIGEVDGDGYTHDVQCVVYGGPDASHLDKELCFASNEDTLTIWNVTGAKASNAEMVARFSYSGSGYTHQGWLSVDHRFFFLNDELDELGSGSRTHLRVVDVSNLDAPQLVADYFAPTLSIDHNNYVHGRWLFQSNYGAGLRILDILDPAHPVEAAYFDTQATDIADFYGTWSNYFFPASGLVAMSDMEDGLYVVRPILSQGTPPDLTVVLSLDEGETDAGGTVSGEFLLSTGTAADATDVLVTLHLPDRATFASLTAPSGWACREIDSGRVQECRGDQSAGTEGSFAFTVEPSSAGDVEVIGMAYADAVDAVPADNLAAVSLRVKGLSQPASGGGGGGGGSVSWMLLAISMFACFGLRTCRR